MKRYLNAMSLLAASSALVGALAIGSALTPDLADRMRLIHGVLPPGLPEVARVLTFVFGLALLLLARSLARGRRRAWTLALIAVSGVSVSHLVKGFDFEEAIISALLMAGLLRYRRHFSAPGNPAVRRPIVIILLLVAGLAGLVIAFDARVPNRIGTLIVVMALFGSLRALMLWLGPFPERVRQSLEERQRAQELIKNFGQDSLAFFALRRDKNYHFLPNSFLAYKLVGSSALISGDPVGRRDEFPALMTDFINLAHKRGWRVAVVGAGTELLGLYQDCGLRRQIKIGDEAIVHPETFSVEGRQMRKVRQAARKVSERDSITFRIERAEQIDEQLRRQLTDVSDVWLNGRRERGFSMASDDLFAPGSIFALALDFNRDPIAFLHLVPSPAALSLSLSSQRRLPGSPGGISEFLVVETMAWAKTAGVRSLSLNFCAFRSLLAGGSRPRRLMRRVLMVADSFFQIERLHVFSRKFLPEWRPRYICLEKLGDLPTVGLAYLRAESLLAPARRDNQVDANI